jgi:hypothetical protein
MAELVRQLALGLSDVVARHSTPLLQSLAVGTTSQLKDAQPLLHQETQPVQMNEQGVKALKGLGGGMQLKRKRPLPTEQ